MSRLTGLKQSIEVVPIVRTADSDSLACFSLIRLPFKPLFVVSVRRQASQAAVRPEPIVKVDPSADSGTSFGAGFKSVQIHAFILELVPEEFNEDIVQPAATAIHGNADTVLPQDIGEREAGGVDLTSGPRQNESWQARDVRDLPQWLGQTSIRGCHMGY